MDVQVLLILLSAFTLSSGIVLFIRKKVLHAVLFLALASLGSSLLFLYLNQILVALLQLLVFVGGLSTYLIVAVATAVKQPKMLNGGRFVVATLIMALGLSLFVYGVASGQLPGNDFSTSAQVAFPNYYALLFASVFLLFAIVICSVIVIRKFSRMVV